MDTQIRPCGGDWVRCDGDCAKCQRYYGITTTETTMFECGMPGQFGHDITRAKEHNDVYDV